MKKTFLAKRNSILSSTSISWGVLALVGAIFALLLRLIAPDSFLNITSPLFSAADTFAAKSHSFIANFVAPSTLVIQNEKLIEENTSLANENQALFQKTVSLEGLFAITPKKSNSSGILAGVIMRPPESPYDVLVLDKGTSAGVALGQEAFGKGGVPIGVVSSVSTEFSRITLFSSSGSVTHGWVGVHADTPVTIFGSGGGTMNASLSRSANISEDDIVFAPGPGALPIGIVTRIDSDPSSPGVTLRIQPMLNLFSISWVELRNTGPSFVDSISWTNSTPI